MRRLYADQCMLSIYKVCNCYKTYSVYIEIDEAGYNVYYLDIDMGQISVNYNE